MNIISDLHTHTFYSHGTGSVRENVIAAIKRGLKRVAITEHASGHVFYGVRGEKLLALRRDIDAAQKEFGRDIDVLMGLECNLTGDGVCDAPIIRGGRMGMFDVLALGFHKGIVPKGGRGLRMFVQLAKLGLDPSGNAEAMIRAVERYSISFITHPGLYIPMDIEILADASKVLNVPLEINSSRVTMTKEQLVLAKERGASFIIGSDAHTPERVGDFAQALRAAEEADVCDRVVNAE
ncbi:MAG: PHP domain-containing protein [Christensenellales bacterium]